MVVYAYSDFILMLLELISNLVRILALEVSGSKAEESFLVEHP
jgi:hypothetical protein